MKATFFQKPLEFRLSVDGESWRQGDPVKGTLTVRNHAPDTVPVSGIAVHLARGTLKKVHQKVDDAFELLGSTPIPASSGENLGPQTELSFPWSFETHRNCAITDTVGSLFLLYGRGEAAQASQLGNIQLPFLPDEVIGQFLDLLKTGFRFVLKSTKWNKGWVEAKLAPPDARGFAMLEQLLISFSFEGDRLHLEYEFKLKKVEASASAVELKKQKTTFKQSYEPAVYRTPSGRFDHERVEKEIRDILSQVESKVLL